MYCTTDPEAVPNTIRRMPTHADSVIDGKLNVSHADRCPLYGYKTRGHVAEWHFSDLKGLADDARC